MFGAFLGRDFFTAGRRGFGLAFFGPFFEVVFTAQKTCLEQTSMDLISKSTLTG
jgi:hypothetical protein